MTKHIDIKNRVVDMFDVDTKDCEAEIIGYLDRKMKVRFHSATFNNPHYVFTGNPKDRDSNAITVSGYRKKGPNECTSIDIGPNY
jgi:hypothetical protein